MSKLSYFPRMDVMLNLKKISIFNNLLCLFQILFGTGKGGNVIFLDFDGVLTTEEYLDSLLAEGKDTRDKYGRLFNPSNVDLLGWIIGQTNAGIVVTSDWRNYLSLWSMIKMWGYRKMPGKIIGVTPSVSIYRGDEIDKCLYKHPEVKNYAIIDDMDYRQFRKEQHPHLVTTNHFSGLDKSSASLAIRILTKDVSLEEM